MNPSADTGSVKEKRGQAASGRARGFVLGVACFSAGIALSAWWFSRTPSNAPSVSNSAPPLTDATTAILRRLQAPVEIRFYSLLDPGSIGESGRDFSGRVDQLLSRYELKAGGKIKVARVNAISTFAAKAAEADGIKAFNIDKGDACFLGIAVVRGNQKTSLSSLAPEWEQALESDLSRAIEGVDTSYPRSQPLPKANVASLAAVKRAIPNLDSVSVEEASQMLRASALAQFQKTGQEMQAKVKQAEEHFLQAQSNQSKADQEAALKELHQTQKDETEQLKEIALESKAQLEALQQIKGASH
jgi:hypothetical protein